MTAPAEKDALWLVHSPCDCEDPGCYGKTDLRLFRREQTARQEADLRSKRYGGYRDRPDMHIEKIAVATKTSGY